MRHLMWYSQMGRINGVKSRNANLVLNGESRYCDRVERAIEFGGEPWWGHSGNPLREGGHGTPELKEGKRGQAGMALSRADESKVAADVRRLNVW